ncbi:MAG: AAA family ATPase [Acidimicrobiia bacterium]|nr:AAA family ATPase [Acidimicrobiia bacterium]
MTVDVAAARERDRRRRLRRVAYVLAPIALWMWWRILSGSPVSPGWPELPPDAVFWLPGIALVLLLAIVFIAPMFGAGKSPHTIYLPEQIEVGFDDVKGLGSVLSEVRHTLDVFLNHARFRDEMGGSPRRGVLFEGPPGTGKTHVAKAMAKEAGVPFLYVSSTAFQSMWYGATARKIRTYFRHLRKVARREGGAIGFIEEIDAIGIARGGVGMSPRMNSALTTEPAISQGTGGVVNELLIQMQSFDEPTRSDRIRNALTRGVNRFLPAERQIKTVPSPFANILLIGATNRADSLDKALLRPGRFDRVLHFGLPGRTERQELVEYFLQSKKHDSELDDPGAIDDVAAMTIGYTPASLERLFDEALLQALRGDRSALTRDDIRQAQLEVEIGLPNPVDYSPEERLTIATHEAGHATIAYLVGKGRKLELLSIIKRRDSLGMLAHREEEERFTQRASEMKAMLKISFGGMVAEEIFFGESGTGPAGDLSAATKLAADMVGSYGLGDAPVSFRAAQGGAFAGDFVAQVLNDPKARKAVDRILLDAKHDTAAILADHRYMVDALRQALLEHEELIGDEIIDVLRDAETAALAGSTALVDLRDRNPRIIEIKKRDEDSSPTP